MTRKTNERLAGAAFIGYIAIGLTSLSLSGRTAGKGTAERLANAAEHAQLLRIDVILTLVCAAFAVILGVTLHALTRDEDSDLAIAAMCCRVAEGIVIILATAQTLALLAIATGSPDASLHPIASMLFKLEGVSATLAATCFAAGSAIFAYLFLRARSIPRILAWLGVVGSVFLVVALPLQLAGFLKGPIVQWMWLPMLLFEVVLAFWLIIRGVNPVERAA